MSDIVFVIVNVLFYALLAFCLIPPLYEVMRDWLRDRRSK